MSTSKSWDKQAHCMGSEHDALVSTIWQSKFVSA